MIHLEDTFIESVKYDILTGVGISNGLALGNIANGDLLISTLKSHHIECDDLRNAQATGPQEIDVAKFSIDNDNLIVTIESCVPDSKHIVFSEFLNQYAQQELCELDENTKKMPMPIDNDAIAPQRADDTDTAHDLSIELTFALDDKINMESKLLELQTNIDSIISRIAKIQKQ